MNRHRVLIVDDHPVIRDGLKALIACEPDLETCGEASDVCEAIQRLRDSKPAVVVLDLGLKNSHGLTALAELHTLAPEVRIVVWSGLDEQLFAERVLRAGALGYVSKTEPLGRVIEAIRQVLLGQICVSGPVAARLLGNRRPSAEDMHPITSLSNREVEVFEFLGQGLTAKQIARRMLLSAKTVETHLANIKKKLKVDSYAKLLQHAVTWQLQRQRPDPVVPE